MLVERVGFRVAKGPAITEIRSESKREEPCQRKEDLARIIDPIELQLASRDCGLKG